MVPVKLGATLRSKKRCAGRPHGGWGAMGKKLSAKACQAACLAADGCRFAVYNIARRTCGSFQTCSQVRELRTEFMVWRKPGDSLTLAGVADTISLLQLDSSFSKEL
jgi:hypothetical protein